MQDQASSPTCPQARSSHVHRVGLTGFGSFILGSKLVPGFRTTYMMYSDPSGLAFLVLPGNLRSYDMRLPGRASVRSTAHGPKTCFVLANVSEHCQDRLPPIGKVLIASETVDNCIRVCTSCPSDLYNHVEALCSELDIRRAFGRKGDFMEDTEGEDWFGHWQNRVLQALDDALQTKREGAISLQSLMITDGNNPNCKREQENMEELAEALQFERGTSLSFQVIRRLLCMQDLETEVCTMTGQFLFACG